jgi:tRNA-dihydrouridine synthase A
MGSFPKQISVAPMMDYTDRHCRYLLRLIAPDIQLYTEMITAAALVRGDAKRLLRFHQAEKPVVLQLGGSDPALLAAAALMGEEAGYNEINLNVGCPSPRVQEGRFGACLMLEPALVASCVLAMREAVRIPVTVKCRIGVDHQAEYTSLYGFVGQVNEVSGCNTFIVHARKAWLSGLSPKQNRDIPPLQYELVHQLKRDFPALCVMINGGIRSVTDVGAQLPFVDGVMIGRAAVANPYLLASLQLLHFPGKKVLSREGVVSAFLPYIDQMLQSGVKLHSLARHLLGLFQGQPGAAIWRRYLSQHASRPGAGVTVIEDALIGMN